MLDKILKFIATKLEEENNRISEIERKHEDSGWIEANGKFCKYRKKNGIVTICGFSAGGGLEIKNSYKVIATLPEGMRPSDGVYFAVNPAGGNASMSGYVNAEGKINLYSSMATTYWAYSVTYPVDD